ncbi:hypothetical protein ACHQM5_007682 [Ranunculus cassubicifolius]
MHNPFFRNHVPSSFPFQTTNNRQGYYPREAPMSNEYRRPSPKVVSIPVHFVESENTRSISAVRIQKVFRGFLVRKNVKKIFGIKSEVDGIEKRIEKTVELIRGDGKERLKVNEMLMALLFKLDSVRGIDSGVRDARKMVIKKAILLQEKLDAIANGDADDQTLVSSESVEEGCLVVDDSNQVMEMDVIRQESEINDHVGDEQVCDCNAVLNSQHESVEEKCDESIQVTEGGSVMVAAEEEVKGVDEVRDGVETEKKDESCIEEDEEGYLIVKKEEEAMEVQQSELSVEDKVGGRDESKEMMEKMMERNEILIGLVAELCEKNKMQTQMITSLTKRVDSLEKAFRCDRSKCKKRK